MKRRILVVVVCLLFTLGICSVAYAKGGGGGGGSSAGNGGSHAGAAHSSSSGSGGSSGGENTGGQSKGGAEGSGNTAPASKSDVKGQEKKQAGEALKTRERVEVREKEKAAANTEPNVRVKGKDIKFDIPPVIKEGRILIPVRAIMNGLGANVTWDEASKTVTITKGDVTVVATLDSKVITVNGEEQTIDMPAQLISNRTFVPIRFVAQALNMNVNWDENNGTVDIGDNTDNSGTDTTGNSTDVTAGSGNSDTTTDGTSGTNTGDTTSGGTSGTEGTGDTSGSTTGTGTTGAN